MLELKNICKTFNPGTINAKVALNHLNLTLKDGDFCTVIGGNGAGKSTMLNAVAGVFTVDSGSIVIDGQDVTRLPEHKRASLLGRVFQDPMMGTAPTMQIEENLALAARRGQRRGLKWGITAVERADYKELLRSLDLGLEDRMTAKVGLLSGGQRQALTLLMAALESPKGILNAQEIAAASKRMFGIAISGGDLRRTMQVSPVRGGIELNTARGLVVLAARAAGVQCFDTVFTDLNDEEGFRAEVLLDKQMGFDGKSLVNPRQIAAVHEIYAPSEKEITAAEKIVRAVRENAAKGVGVFTVDGKMIDIAFLPGAERTIALAKACGMYKGEL